MRFNLTNLCCSLTCSAGAGPMACLGALIFIASANDVADCSGLRSNNYTSDPRANMKPNTKCILAVLESTLDHGDS